MTIDKDLDENRQQQVGITNAELQKQLNKGLDKTQTQTVLLGSPATKSKDQYEEVEAHHQYVLSSAEEGELEVNRQL